MEVSKAKPQLQAQTSQPVQAPKRAEQVQQAQKHQEQLHTQQAQTSRAVENKPRPTVNGQGQTIGTRLSVTA